MQTDSCLSRTLFTSNSEIEDFKTDLLGKISELREGFAALKNHPLPSNTILDSSDKLNKSLTDLKRFDNVQHVFLCKIPARFDSHNINSKVSRFIELLVERYLDTEEWITVIDTLPPEI